MTKLKPDIKAAWVEALRSGKYQQGKNYLNSEGRYCCLGVLCELAVEAGVTGRNAPEGPYRVVSYGARADDTGCGPDVVRWAYEGHPGMGAWMVPFEEGDPGNPFPDRDEVHLIALNDDGEKTFGEIADVIERYL